MEENSGKIQQVYVWSHVGIKRPEWRRTEPYRIGSVGDTTQGLNQTSHCTQTVGNNVSVAPGGARTTLWEPPTYSILAKRQQQEMSYCDLEEDHQMMCSKTLTRPGPEPTSEASFKTRLHHIPGNPRGSSLGLKTGGADRRGIRSPTGFQGLQRPEPLPNRGAAQRPAPCWGLWRPAQQLWSSQALLIPVWGFRTDGHRHTE